MEKEVVLVKLSNGDVLIGYLEGKEEGTIVMSSVDQIVQTGVQFGFLTYMPYSTGLFVINLVGAVVATPSSEMLDEFTRSKSAIYTPPKSIITG